MNSFNMYRPAFSVANLPGFIAGVCNPQAKRAENIAARIRMARAALSAAIEAQRLIADGHDVPASVFEKFAVCSPIAKDAERIAWRTLVYLRAARMMGALPTHLETFLGLVPETDPEVRDLRTLDQLLSEARRKSSR